MVQHKDTQNKTEQTICVAWTTYLTAYKNWGHRGRDRMVVGSTTTSAISAYHH